MRLVWLALGAALLGVGARSEQGPAASAVFQMDYSNPGLTPAHWTLTINPDGSGHFQSERGSPKAGAQASGPREGQQQESQQGESQQMGASDVNRDVRVSAEFAQHVFETARRHRFFNVECDSRLKVAFQGLKTLSYNGPAGKGSCSFNYAKDREIGELGDSLVAVGGTILEGARLEALLQYDRLGLDKEMDYLAAAAADGQLQQICTIRGILERLADDESVLERVRKRARVLLARAGT